MVCTLPEQLGLILSSTVVFLTFSIFHSLFTWCRVRDRGPRVTGGWSMSEGHQTDLLVIDQHPDMGVLSGRSKPFNVSFIQVQYLQNIDGL